MKYRLTKTLFIRQVLLAFFLLAIQPTSAQENIALTEDSFFIYNDYWFVILDKEEKTAAYYGAGEWEGMCFKSYMGSLKYSDEDGEDLAGTNYYYNRLELATVGKNPRDGSLTFQKALRIMGEVNGFTITEIYPYAFANSRIAKADPHEAGIYIKDYYPTQPGFDLYCGCVYEELVIPDGIKIIGKKAFTGLNEDLSYPLIDIGKDVTTIDSQAFPFSEQKPHTSRWYTEVVISRNEVPPTVCEDNFPEYFTDRATLFVPKEAISAYKEHEVWGRFREIASIESMIRKDPLR